MENEKNFNGEARLSTECDAEEDYEAMKKERRELFREFVLTTDRITPRQREVCVFLYGFEDGVPHTMTEAAEKFGLPRERVRLISRAVRRKMPRYHLTRRKRLIDYLDG